MKYSWSTRTIIIPSPLTLSHSLSLSLVRFLSLLYVQRRKRRGNFVEIMREKLMKCRTDRRTVELDKGKREKKNGVKQKMGRENRRYRNINDRETSVVDPTSSLSLSLSLSLLRLSRHARTDVPETDVFSTLSGIYVDRSWAERAVRVLTKKNRERRKHAERRRRVHNDIVIHDADSSFSPFSSIRLLRRMFHLS